MSSVQQHSPSPRFGNATSSFATTVTSHIHPGHEHVSSHIAPNSLTDNFQSFVTKFGPAPEQASSHTKVAINNGSAPTYTTIPNTQPQPATIHQDAYTTLQPAVIQQDAFTTLQPKGSYQQSAPLQQQAPTPSLPQNHILHNAMPSPIENTIHQTPAKSALQNNIIQQAPTPQQGIPSPLVQGQAGHILNYAQAPIYIPGYITKSSFMKKNRLNLANDNFANGAFADKRKSKVAIVTKDVAAIGGPAAVAGALLGTKIGLVGSAVTLGADHGVMAISGPVLGAMAGIIGGLGAFFKSGFDINRNIRVREEDVARIKDAVLASGKLGLAKGQWKLSPSRASRKANDRTAEEINRDLSQGITDKVYRLKMPNGRKTMSVYVPGAHEAQKYLARTNG